ncbi:uncharacterized protein L969DRAFT_92637 [Mixia osmundae IAM 14324]|uniref:Uncharacterized protein n=1 Tax=Mixia osmundae (strain CBS 9802 / IAM 14324 / JCM 22182 / KY 12970) TaxID=764103 RepID=G7DY45_MIXOS|nr:uncharacterized protein L969DRAFT_92637 [Mixia osmundae IAM 14324]KEI41407.1 hypothetical protein L969DRAFT_92637 [Mixia osmundae IAM 14324]GAA95505.1 hypothetical protein E5Q_02160 [Mixia osmundae IAM 14324]
MRVVLLAHSYLGISWSVLIFRSRLLSLFLNLFDPPLAPYRPSQYVDQRNLAREGHSRAARLKHFLLRRRPGLPQYKRNLLAMFDFLASSAILKTLLGRHYSARDMLLTPLIVGAPSLRSVLTSTASRMSPAPGASILSSLRDQRWLAMWLVAFTVAHETCHATLLAILARSEAATKAVRLIEARGQSVRANVSDAECPVCLGSGPTWDTATNDSPFAGGQENPLEAFCSAEGHELHRQCLFRWFEEKQLQQRLSRRLPFAAQDTVRIPGLNFTLNFEGQLQGFNVRVTQLAPTPTPQLIGQAMRPWGMPIDGHSIVRSLDEVDRSANDGIHLYLLDSFVACRHAHGQVWWQDFDDQTARAARLAFSAHSGASRVAVLTASNPGPSCAICRGPLSIELHVSPPPKVADQTEERNSSILSLSSKAASSIWSVWSDSLGPASVAAKLAASSFWTLFLWVNSRALADEYFSVRASRDLPST